MTHTTRTAMHAPDTERERTESHPPELVWVLACIGWHRDLGGWSDDGIESDLPALVLKLDNAEHDDDAGHDADDNRHLAAVVCPVKAVDYIGERAEERFEDAAWIAERSVRHDDVISSAMRRGPVFPIAFGSIFRSHALVLDRVGALSVIIRDTLEVFENRAECAITVACDQAQVLRRMQDGQTSGDPHEPDKASGSSYLRRKKADRAATSEIAPWVIARSLSAVNAILSIGFMCQVREVSSTPTDDGTPIRKIAMLFDTDSESAIDAAIEHANATLNPDGISIRASGPWPPYTFAADAVTSS